MAGFSDIGVLFAIAQKTITNMRNSFACSCLVLLSSLFSTVTAQNYLNGAFAGSDVSYTITGMARYDYAYLFRPDGTFTSELAKKDFQTRVDGHYTITGKKMRMVFNNGSESFKTVNSASWLFGGFDLFKYEIVDQVPPHTFKYTNGASMGGEGTGMPYTGGMGSSYLSLDGKGNFSNTSFGTGSIASPDFSHGSFSKSGGDGTYTLKNGLLTLKYKDGTVVTQSFFYSGGKTTSALINGTVYYAMTADDATGDKGKPVSANNKTAGVAPDGAAVLKNAQLAHGGKKLDDIKTVKLEAAAGNATIVMLMDFNRKYIRYEYWQQGNLVTIEQSEDNSGWQWSKGNITPLTATRNTAMQASFNSGVLALRTPVLQKITVTAAEKKEGGMQSVFFTMDNNKYAYIFDKDYHLVGEVNVAGGVQQAVLSSEFKTVGGISIPFHVVIKSNNQETVIQYKSVVVNPLLSESDWQKK